MQETVMEKIQLKFPAAIAGVHSVKCECGYETTAVLPEEQFILLQKILEHIQQHGVEIPLFTIELF